MFCSLFALGSIFSAILFPFEVGHLAALEPLRCLLVIQLLSVALFLLPILILLQAMDPVILIPAARQRIDASAEESTPGDQISCRDLHPLRCSGERKKK